MNFNFAFKSLMAITLLISTPLHALEWRGIFISGDDSIDNFDHAREDLSSMFATRGNLQTLQFSSSEKYISAENNVMAATVQNIIPAFESFNLLPNQGCLIHMTSHGQKNNGFYFSMAGVLPPVTFETLLDAACGTAPTVILVSACYSGQFITETIKRSNLIIMTAARADRPSFGCSADTHYTYWDGCLLEEMPQSETWTELDANVKACITEKETAIGAQPSEPQSFFGEDTLEWTILH